MERLSERTAACNSVSASPAARAVSSWRSDVHPTAANGSACDNNRSYNNRH